MNGDTLKPGESCRWGRPFGIGREVREDFKRDYKTSQELISTREGLLEYTLIALDAIDEMFTEGPVEGWELIEAWKKELGEEALGRLYDRIMKARESNKGN
jgi:hypothetical protein